MSRPCPIACRSPRRTVRGNMQRPSLSSAVKRRFSEVKEVRIFVFQSLLPLAGGAGAAMSAPPEYRVGVPFRALDSEEDSVITLLSAAGTQASGSVINQIPGPLS